MSPRPQTPAPVKLAPLGSRIASRRQQVAERPPHLHVVEPGEPTQAEPIVQPVAPPTEVPDATPDAVAALVDAEPATEPVVSPLLTDEGLPTVGESLIETESEPEPAPAPTVGEAAVAANPEPAPQPSMKPAPVKSDQSDGGSARVTFAVPTRCIQRIRQLSAKSRLPQADVLVIELAKLAAQPPVMEEQVRPMVGDFELSSTPVREPLANLGIRLTKKNLDAMDALCERLGLANRSALVAKALAQ